MSNYRLISSDSHVYEPADLWERYIDPEFRERAPRLVHELDTDQWYADGDVKFGVVGTNQQAGLRYEDPDKITMEGRYSDAPAGGWDPHAHVADLEVDGVSGSVLYPSVGLNAFKLPASDLVSAIFRGYNTWLSEFCQYYPDKLKGIALVNVDDILSATYELRRAAELGLVGVVISMRPSGPSYAHPSYDDLWALSQDLHMPISLHVGTSRWRAESTGTLLDQLVEQTTRDAYPRNAIASMIFSGVFERFPNLRVGTAEFGLAWAPFFLERMDHLYTERATVFQVHRFAHGSLPSDVFRNNVFLSFQEDELGIQLRHHVGVENLLWGSDYPHAESTFPRSRAVLEEILVGVPSDEQAKIAGQNTAWLYGYS
ncbi:MAG: hypothetical protein FI680_00985 [SAR202 cluster bacterium]|nr:hypothetical protein [SAR202 cluster bacterium]